MSTVTPSLLYRPVGLVLRVLIELARAGDEGLRQDALADVAVTWRREDGSSWAPRSVDRVVSDLVAFGAVHRSRHGAGRSSWAVLRLTPLGWAWWNHVLLPTPADWPRRLSPAEVAWRPPLEVVPPEELDDVAVDEGPAAGEPEPETWEDLLALAAAEEAGEVR